MLRHPYYDISHVLRPIQNGRQFAYDISQCIFMKENYCVLIHISFFFVHKGLIESRSSLVPVMAWLCIGDKTIPEPMVTLFTGAYTSLGLTVLTSLLLRPGGFGKTVSLTMLLKAWLLTQADYHQSCYWPWRINWSSVCHKEIPAPSQFREIGGIQGVTWLKRFVCIMINFSRLFWYRKYRDLRCSGDSRILGNGSHDFDTFIHLEYAIITTTCVTVLNVWLCTQVRYCVQTSAPLGTQINISFMFQQTH